MIPPKYNFYIGKLNKYTYLLKDNGINDSGEIVYESGKYSYGPVYLDEQALIFIDLQSTDRYNAVFFYDDSLSLISYHSLLDYNNVIEPPLNAKYWAIRLVSQDANFVAEKQLKFVYSVYRVNPHYKELSKKYTKENEQEFFRTSLEGKINLFGKDYAIVSNSDIEDQHIFLINKYDKKSNSWPQYYKGGFSKTDCRFDHAKGKCELKISPVDQYSEIMNKYENVYDLIKLAPEITKIDIHKRSLTQIYILGSNSVSSFFGGTYLESEVIQPIDSADDLIHKYYFAYVKSGNEFYIKNAKLSEVNGVYAGVNGQWDNWNGYTCYLELTTPNTYGYIYLKRNSDNAILYKSVIPWTSADINDIYIDTENVKMVNVNDSTDTFTIESPFVYKIYRRLLCDVDTILDNGEIKSLYDLPADDFVSDNKNFKKCVGYKGGIFYCSSKVVDTPTKYGINDYGKYFTNQFIPMSRYRLLPICRSSWANASLWFAYDEFTYEANEERLRKRYTVKDTYSIAAVIKALLGQIEPTLKHEATAEYSRFLYDQVTPFNFTRFYVYLTQKTNILKGDYDQPAQKAEISLEELTKMLRDCFRCYWYIEDNKFKIEHISFFINGGKYSADGGIQLDFTTLTDSFNKKSPCLYQAEIEYDKANLAQRYEFNWMDDATELFGGVVLDVKSDYVQKNKVEKIVPNQFSADIDYMLFNPSAFSNDGFALLCAVNATIAKYKQSIEKKVAISYKLLDSLPAGSSVKIKISSSSSIRKLYISSDMSTTDTLYSGTVSSSTDREIDLTVSKDYNNIYLWANASDVITSGELSIEIISDSQYELPIVNAILIDENENEYSAIIQNWYASWAYLTTQFYMFDMPARAVKSNVAGGIFAEVKKSMQQTIEFFTETDLDEFQLIRTKVGDGKIGEFSVNMQTGLAKVKLLYEPL